jgi:ribonuclease M5
MMPNCAKKLPKLSLPVIVEGKYDKAAVCSMFSGAVIATDGFGVFNSKEKQALIRAVCKNGVILLTDSDGAGKVIRGFLSGIIPKDKIYQLYVPEVEGKEKRKSKRSKEGLLGVEGVGADILRPLLEPFCIGEGLPVKNEISTADLYALGLTGAEGSAALRDKVCASLGLPSGMGAKAFAAAVSIVSDRDKLAEMLSDEKKSDI